MFKQRNLEITVGLFVIAACVSLGMLALTVSGLSDFYAMKQAYDITADFENIGGLKPRARVTIAGVTVGRVTAIEIDPDTYWARVTLAIHEEVQDLPGDTRASILTAGLLGDNYIGLTPGYDETEFLQENSHIVDTTGAIVLEQLISKFVSSQASE